MAKQDRLSNKVQVLAQNGLLEISISVPENCDVDSSIEKNDAWMYASAKQTQQTCSVVLVV